MNILCDDAICFNCVNVLEQMEYNDVSFHDLGRPPIKIAGFDENIVCSRCYEGLEAEDFYLISEEEEQDFLCLIGRYLGEEISTRIEYCSNCKGREIEDFDYVYEKEMGKPPNLSFGIEITDFLGEFNIYGVLEKYVLENLTCQNCGHGEKDEYNSHFEISESVYTENDLDKFYGVNDYLDYAELNKLSVEYGIEFDKNEMNSFIDLLSKSPTLALSHEVGEKIYHLLNGKYKDLKFYRLDKGNKIVRGRKRYSDQVRLSDNSLWNPPQGKASHGRFNTVGTSVFYGADKKVGLPYELNPTGYEYIDYGVFKVEKDLKLLDLYDVFSGDFTEFISARNVESNLLKRGYLLTNFISNCCESIGYDGILYAGVHKKVDYYNYALYNVSKDSLLSLNEVKTISTDITYNVQEKYI